ncbi:uncharacterized protein LOC135471459 [Liolophura sinensis]|uniref:uncharacterized protein LOC135471459 n=1 Tax=Liolophura sinensis TaxID=3198878 RepID=UPI003158E696
MMQGSPRHVVSQGQFRMLLQRDDRFFPGMNKIKIKGKDLTNIPPSLFTLARVEVLELTPERESCLDFKLPLVPAAIGKLVNLKVVCLDTNELLEVPPEMCLLKNLERLALSNNNLTSLPVGISELRKLASLHVANNDFRDFPLQVCKLENLEFLDFSDNQLISLPEEIGELKQLVTLLVCYNDLTSLPDTLCSLTELTCLWLGNNRIQQLPRRFGNLRKLDWGVRYTSSTLEGNPLIHPPLEICRMGPEAIEKYLSSTETGGRNQRLRQTNRKPKSKGTQDLVP